MKQPHRRTRLQRVALLVNPANFFHATAASQIAFEAIAQAHYGAVFVVADALLVSEAAYPSFPLRLQPQLDQAAVVCRNRPEITHLLI
jgi:predicted amidohydrolase